MAKPTEPDNFFTEKAFTAYTSLILYQNPDMGVERARKLAGALVPVDKPPGIDQKG